MKKLRVIGGIANSHVPSFFLFCLSFLALTSFSVEIRADDAWWQEYPSAVAKAKLASIFGEAYGVWDIVDARGISMPAPALGEWNGRPVLTNCILRCANDVAGDSEFLFALAFPGEEIAAQNFNLRIGDFEKKTYLNFQAVRRERDMVSVNIGSQIEGTNEPSIRAAASFYAKGHNARALGWPEDFRRRVEAQFAALPPLRDQWITLRIVSETNRCRAYLNGQIFADLPVPGARMAGSISAQLSGSVMLSMARVIRPQTTGRFAPIDLSIILNSAKLDGRSVADESLPPAGQPVLIDGVPFVFPSATAAGFDHVDVGESWYQLGFLEGYFSSHFGGVFGGRWPHPLVRNPGRLQVAVPRAQYCRLHLIAASDGDKDSLPEIFVQFYRPNAGYPQEFSAIVPKYDAGNIGPTALPVRLGRQHANLYHIVVPIEPGRLAELAQMDRDSFSHSLGLEFTKRTDLYRSYPDPICYSRNGAGLPSGVHVYAATLEEPVVRMDLQPSAIGHVWTAPAVPAYTIALTNSGREACEASIELRTRSNDGAEETRQTKDVKLAPGGSNKYAFNLSVKKYGYHDLILSMRAGTETWTEQRSFALLRPDTRDRDWQPGRGAVFGVWSYAPGHTTPSFAHSLEVSGAAGLQLRGGLYSRLAGSESSALEENKEALAICEKYKIFSLNQCRSLYSAATFARDLAEGNIEKAEKTFMDALIKSENKPTSFSRPEAVTFFPEPGCLYGPMANLSDYFGEPRQELSEAAQKRFDYWRNAILRGSKLVRQRWPDAKILVPHGDPMFIVPFLRAGKECTQAMDGIGIDSPNFERVPEMQIGNYTIHRQWQVNEEMKKAGMTDPYLMFVEGNFLPTCEGALTLREQADYQVRNTLHYYAYGVNRLATIAVDFDCGDYYSEEHYGAGICTRYPIACPKPAYAAMAALTRQLNGMNFIRYVPTRSATVFCLQYQHWKVKNKLLHILWTVRGTRPACVFAASNAVVEVYDQMDNKMPLQAQSGQVSLTLDASPCYVWGLTESPEISLGQPDHSDIQPAPAARTIALGNPGDGAWRQSGERDETYENNWPGQMARFPGNMSIEPVEAPAAQGGRALAISFGKQEKERITMPWYTTICPRRPIEIPGKASHLGMWVKANSDWGRIIYSLRDAAGERWISIGTREQWNCDDIHCWSRFCFDGWRYLRFELPANSPYDQFRESGSTWWGHFGPGDGMVDLPLTLEKVIIERRSHVMYVNEPIAADTGDVMLASLNAEYAGESDMGREAVRLAGLRMPLPRGKPELDNPLVRLKEMGTLRAPAITRVEDPTQHANGTQCHVYFEPVAGAKSYDIWVAPYEDGRGAMQLAKEWQAPGNMLRGLRPEVDFYLFLVYTNDKKETSKPSAPFHVKLKDVFAQK